MSEVILLILSVPFCLIWIMIFAGPVIEMENERNGTEGWFQRKPKEKGIND